MAALGDGCDGDGNGNPNDGGSDGNDGKPAETTPEEQQQMFSAAVKGCPAAMYASSNSGSTPMPSSEQASSSTDLSFPPPGPGAKAKAKPAGAVPDVETQIRVFYHYPTTVQPVLHRARAQCGANRPAVPITVRFEDGLPGACPYVPLGADPDEDITCLRTRTHLARSRSDPNKEFWREKPHKYWDGRWWFWRDSAWWVLMGVRKDVEQWKMMGHDFYQCIV